MLTTLAIASYRSLRALLLPLPTAELSDGTLRYLLRIAFLQTPRPPPLMMLNEPETSLPPDLLPAPARLIVKASPRSQVWVVSHASRLIAALQSDAGCRRIRLERNSARPASPVRACLMNRPGAGRASIIGCARSCRRQRVWRAQVNAIGSGLLFVENQARCRCHRFSADLLCHHLPVGAGRDCARFLPLSQDRSHMPWSKQDVCRSAVAMMAMTARMGDSGVRVIKCS